MRIASAAVAPGINPPPQHASGIPARKNGRHQRATRFTQTACNSRIHSTQKQVFNLGHRSLKSGCRLLSTAKKKKKKETAMGACGVHQHQARASHQAFLCSVLLDCAKAMMPLTSSCRPRKSDKNSIRRTVATLSHAASPVSTPAANPSSSRSPPFPLPEPSSMAVLPAATVLGCCIDSDSPFSAVEGFFDNNCRCV